MNLRVLIKILDVLNPSSTIPLGVVMGLIIVLLGLDHVIIGVDILLDPTAAVQFRPNSSPAIAILFDEIIVARDAA